MSPVKTSDVPIYNVPSQGLLSYSPRSWVPYIELMRLEKPIETWITYFPFLFGTLYAGCISDPIPKPDALLVANLALFTIASLLHSTGCTWNDIIDRDLDRQIARCRLRPVARGAVSPRNGYILFAAQLLLCLCILWQTCKPGLGYAALYIVQGIFYPFTKRFTVYPQIVLGFTVALGFMIGFVALGTSPVVLASEGSLNAILALAALYMSQVVWAVIGDTIYAYQDVEDDMKAGVKSMSVYYRHSLKPLLSTMVLIQVGFLVLAGRFMGAGMLYFVGACLGNATFLSLMVQKVDLKKPQECGWWFRNGNWLVGWTLSAGLFGEYLCRYLFM